MDCRVGCGACCIAISISSLKKKAGERCIYLTKDNLCQLFGQPERPEVCKSFLPSKEICGESFKEAYRNLTRLENYTGA